MSYLTTDTDIAVLGGGAAGLAAAREALRRGARATIVNDGPLGGDCTFTGCVPSKTVIEAAHAGRSFADAFEMARRVRERIADSESAAVLEDEGIRVIEGEGTLVVDRRSPAIAVGGDTVRAKGVVLALGSRPAIPPIDGLDTVDVLSTDDLWELTDRPRSMVVVGGGAIGCELSQALAKLGVEVTIVELGPRLLIKEEAAAASIVATALKTAGVTILTGVAVSAVRRSPGGATLELDDGRTVEAERILMAVGRSPNSRRGGMIDAGVALDDRGYVVNSDDLATSVAGVYVAGDLAGRLQFTHAADHMGRLAVSNLLSKTARWRPSRFRAEQIPWVTFTRPEVAQIGPTEAEATRSIEGAMVAELPLTEHDRALTAGATDGYIKLIAGPQPLIGSVGGGRIIGATIVAERAGEMISELALAVRTGMFTGRLAQTVHPYPTWSYGIAKAAGQFFTTIEGRSARPARSPEYTP